LQDVQDSLEGALGASSQQFGTGNATAETEKHSQDASDQPVLIIDGLDFLIASQPNVTATDVSQMLTIIRQHVHSTILAVSSDGPLLHGTGISTTPLEQEHQALVAALAHQSRLVMQLRSLDTGTAKDISGVIRISHGGGYENEMEEQVVAEGEWLYKVSGDGSVRVWGRGE
jgi:elongator complex protein 6